ncbi:NAD(P)/FAD-dependent oxidoreductase [Xanthomonas melonis]|uniref:NAD(P)/FAD-dependent oxidoreductase n=1 Tax=Xanthomonas melonis TaxID=56456 RepID=A0ABS8NQ54_9XANT|nr:MULTISPECIES: NAD(P)/FAD-dependent oxidoreductase [Xanthomonas]MCC4588270.1 NAD(P)/FAD-dependent oxidoreductase [Xanthomonas sp. NCPPB 1067]MCD0256855.1 NAD(P)/FAD-dependent oxidoreductase [Xanthomonas melonis]MCD0265113.1 NAD(P)/FAD-dependent oxidoreductase [Xanthomonas melonis]
MSKHVVIIGAGPAGLTAALELVGQPGVQVTVLEADDCVGGISRTVNHNGNRIDIGGHRFFSKSDWVMQWWTNLMPIEHSGDVPLNLRYQGQARDGLPAGAAVTDGAQPAAMLVRNRLSRIYFNRRLFSYPLKLDVDSFRKLGVAKSLLFGFSYLRAQVSKIEPEVSLEDFLINRFGQRLYGQFFKEYTEKVWGVPCNQISAEWGAQRIKSLSVTKAVVHALRGMLGLNEKVAQTSLIENFLYPKHGPGEMWETAAQLFQARGGTLLMKHKAVGLAVDAGQVHNVTVQNEAGEVFKLDCSHVVSTMPMRDLVAASRQSWGEDIVAIADNLQYRDFITVGLLYRASELPRTLGDNWIYIQEPGVNVGRVQIFNNWSPHMVKDASMVWMGLEFFCRETDELWTMSDVDLQELAQREMLQIGLVSAAAAQDAVVIRVPKAYPGYFGESYARFEQLRTALDAVPNLFLVGRNGMHRYNNQDHSMLTAKEAAEQILTGNVDKNRLWSINVDDEYHEEAKA